MAVDFASFCADAALAPPRIALVLGSGMSGVADSLCDIIELPFAAIPGLESATVAGHRGSIMLGAWAGVRVLVCAGRLHYYEGHSWDRVLTLVRLVHQLGAGVFLATNAAGGIRGDLGRGSLMMLTGHQDWTRRSWWRGFEESTYAGYDADLQQRLESAAQRLRVSLTRGIYAQVTGPSYETPAEVRALRACGADAVGMSTGREIEEAARLGLRCAAISCITNRAAGLSAAPISHEEVLETTARQGQVLADLLEAFMPTAVAGPGVTPH